jgi:hypothetical protein
MIGCFSLSDSSEFSDDVSLSQMRSEVPHFIGDEQSRSIIWAYAVWTCNASVSLLALNSALVHCVVALRWWTVPAEKRWLCSRLRRTC